MVKHLFCSRDKAEKQMYVSLNDNPSTGKKYQLQNVEDNQRQETRVTTRKEQVGCFTYSRWAEDYSVTVP